jgi:hypothetical protein
MARHAIQVYSVKCISAIIDLQVQINNSAYALQIKAAQSPKADVLLTVRKYLLFLNLTLAFNVALLC